MNKELEIKEKYDKGATVYSLSKEYSMDKKTIKKIIKQGKYYLDIKSGEIIFTSKKISFEEQAFNYICFKYGVENGRITYYYENTKEFGKILKQVDVEYKKRKLQLKQM